MEAASSSPSSFFHLLADLSSLPAITLVKLPSILHVCSANRLSKTRASKLHSSFPTHTPRIPPITSQFLFKNRRQVFPVEENTSPMSFPIHTKNPYVICKEIQRLSRQDDLQEALTLLDHAVQIGFPVNPTTFSCLITACIRSKSLEKARKIHTHIRMNGLENNEFLCTKLVQMYSSCGSTEDAKRIFDRLPCKGTVYPWNALLRGNVVSGRRQCDRVHSVFSKMRELGIELDVFAFSCMLKSFAGASSFTQGLQIHALLTKNGLLSSSVLMTSLIDLYFKCSKIKLAQRMFEEVPKRDVVVWGAMIAGFAHNRLEWQALDYLRQMTLEGLAPNSVVLCTILPVIADVSARKLGCEAHAFVLKTKNYSTQLFIQSALIDMYCKCGDIGTGRRVFYASSERNVVSWTALMSGYLSNGKLELALRSILWMQQEGFRPDVVTVATALPACTKLRALKQGKEIHGYALRNGLVPHAAITTSLMVMYSKCSNLDYSFKLFDGMVAKNVISWTAMMDSFVENGQLYDALGVFRAMQKRPDCVATARVLSICGKLQSSKLGREIHGHILRRDFSGNPHVSAELVRMYGRCHAIDKAVLVFEELPIKHPVTWTAVIQAFGYNELFLDAIGLFHEMSSAGFAPNHYTFEVVISLCLQAGLADEACQMFDLMTQQHRIKVCEEHYSRIIELLSRVGRFEEANRYMRMRSFVS